MFVRLAERHQRTRERERERIFLRSEAMPWGMMKKSKTPPPDILIQAACAHYPKAYRSGSRSFVPNPPCRLPRFPLAGGGPLGARERSAICM